MATPVRLRTRAAQDIDEAIAEGPRRIGACQAIDAACYARQQDTPGR